MTEKMNADNNKSVVNSKTVASNAPQKVQKVIPLEMEITSVSPLGVVTIMMNKPVAVRKIDGKLPPFLFQANYIQSQDSIKQSMDYRISNFTETQIDLQIQFEKPLSVSQGQDKDYIEVRLLKNYFAMEDQILQRRLTANPDEGYLIFRAALP